MSKNEVEGDTSGGVRAGTQIASDVGSIANSPNGPTFHAPPAHSNHPAETFLKGMHTLARGCQAQRWLPRVRAPQTALHS
jgi:hypothetical protein